MKLIAAVACWSFLVACGSATPASDMTADGGDIAPETTSGPDRSAPPAAQTNGDGTASVADGGASPASTLGVFAGAPSYAPTLGPSTLIKRHVFGGDNPAGQACLSCHTGAKGIPRFLFAGTIYANGVSDGGVGTPAARVEVRVLDSKGATHAAFTDANGNFFFAQGAEPDLAPPAKAGIRDSASTMLMTNSLNNGDCNGCHHVGDAVGVLHMP